MPQDDIRAKQQALSGHHWLNLIDFASGFYAMDIDPKSRPYTAFYVKGKGYFQCAKMPFGLTGAPSTFAHMTTTHLHDFIADGTLELFVDDGGSGMDEFEEGIEKLEKIFKQKESLQEEKLVQMASPDPAKLTAVVNWEQPEDALNLSSFLGITSHFCDLIKGYAQIEGLLQNLLKQVSLKPNCSRMEWRNTYRNFKLDNTRWKMEHIKSFIALKQALTSEPIL
uniref:Reverse transcriptase domain-containing protein n=1 Tax=Moniliophthora roreri TaxID=221103 RepID=A0A0W0FII4_MONRR